MIRENNLLFEVYSVNIYFLTYGFFSVLIENEGFEKKYYIFEELLS